MTPYHADEAAVVPVEYLYGTWTLEDADGYIVTRVEAFRIKKKTAKRIFYYADWIHGDLSRVRSVDRATLEATGSVYNHSAGWWSPDFHLFADRADVEPAPVETAAAKVSRLRAEMAAAHPDRGGDDAAFIQAHQRYQRAVSTESMRRSLGKTP